jgi:ABC-2 type transport system permease protein
MLSIWGREVRTYFKTPSFYIIIGLFLTFMSFTWIMLLNSFTAKVAKMAFTQGGEQGLNLHRQVFMTLMENVNFVLLILVPFLTARLLAEEKKLKTFDLLLTSPITSAQIVMGKYLGGLSITWLLCGLTFLYPLSVAKFTEIQWGVLLTAYTGLLLVVAMYVAIGLFASSLTDSNLLSGFVAIILSLGLWYMSWGSATAVSPLAIQIFDHLSVAQHFSKMLEGSIQIISFAFTLSVITLFCFLSERVVESERWRA